MEAVIETLESKTVTFEFHTLDFDPNEVSSAFVSAICVFRRFVLNLIVFFYFQIDQLFWHEQHRKFINDQLLDLALQLKDNPHKIPIVRIPVSAPSAEAQGQDPSKVEGHVREQNTGSDPFRNLLNFKFFLVG